MSTLPTIQVYEGDYVADKKHGQGTYRWPSGACFTGKFKQDCKDGPGVYTSAEGDKFEVRLLVPVRSMCVGGWMGGSLVA